MIPIAARDPGSSGHSRGESLNARDEVRRSSRVAQLHRREIHPAGEKVYVRIDESRDDHAATRINHLRLRRHAKLNLGCRPDGRDPVAAQRDGLGPRFVRFARPDDAVYDGDGDRVLIGCNRHRAGEEKGAARERQAKTHRQKLAKIIQVERALPWKSVSAILAARPIKDDTKRYVPSNPRASCVDESKEPQTEKEQ